jgi:hypothetical protein
LRGRHDVEIEEEGRTVILPAESMSFWRGTIPDDEFDEDGKFFQTVLVANVGYFSRR